VQAWGFTSEQEAFIACSSVPGKSWALFTPPVRADTAFGVLDPNGTRTDHSRRRPVRISSELSLIVGIPEEQVRWACQTADLPAHIRLVGNRAVVPIKLTNPTDRTLSATLDIHYRHKIGWQRGTAASARYTLPTGTCEYPLAVTIAPPTTPSIHRGRLRLGVADGSLPTLTVPVTLDVINPVAVAVECVRPRVGDEPAELKLTCEPRNQQGWGATVFVSGPHFKFEPFSFNIPAGPEPSEFIFSGTLSTYGTPVAPTSIYATVVTRDGYSFREQIALR